MSRKINCIAKNTDQITRFRLTNRVKTALKGVCRGLSPYGTYHWQVTNGSTIEHDTFKLILFQLMILCSIEKEAVLKSDEEIKTYGYGSVSTSYDRRMTLLRQRNAIFTCHYRILNTGSDGSVQKRLTITRVFSTTTPNDGINQDNGEWIYIDTRDVLTMTIRQKENVLIDFYITDLSHLISGFSGPNHEYENGFGLFDLNVGYTGYMTVEARQNQMRNMAKGGFEFTMGPFMKQFMLPSKIWNTFDYKTLPRIPSNSIIWDKPECCTKAWRCLRHCDEKWGADGIDAKKISGAARARFNYHVHDDLDNTVNIADKII